MISARWLSDCPDEATSHTTYHVYDDDTGLRSHQQRGTTVLVGELALSWQAVKVVVQVVSADPEVSGDLRFLVSRLYARHQLTHLLRCQLLLAARAWC